MGVRSRTLMATLMAAILLPGTFAQRPEIELELDTQKLEVLPEPPAAVTADATRLIFGIAPIRTSGLLTNQLRASVRALVGSHSRARFVHLRAFVAGSGDSRRVQEVVSEVFQNRRRPLPALSVIQVGGLPQEGAQVILEYVAEERRAQNPGGIAFVSSGTVSASSQTLEVAPLVDEALDRMRDGIGNRGTQAPEILRATCYCSSLADAAQVRRAMLDAFPGATVNYVQTRRSYTRGAVACEAVARLPEPAGESRSVSGEPSQVAVVGPGQLIFTGAQLGFRSGDEDIRLAFERLGRVLAENGSSLERVVKWNIFPLSLAMADRIRDVGLEFVSQDQPPVTVLVEAEGLPSLDASFAVDMVAVE